MKITNGRREVEVVVMEGDPLVRGLLQDTPDMITSLDDTKFLYWNDQGMTVRFDRRKAREEARRRRGVE